MFCATQWYQVKYIPGFCIVNFLNGSQTEVCLSFRLLFVLRVCIGSSWVSSHSACLAPSEDFACLPLLALVQGSLWHSRTEKDSASTITIEFICSGRQGVTPSSPCCHFPLQWTNSSFSTLWLEKCAYGRIRDLLCVMWGVALRSKQEVYTGGSFVAV